MIKTFKGQMSTTEEKRLRLSTKDGLIGYQIKKFQIINANPGAETTEAVAKIFSESQGSGTNTVNFDSPLLKACAYLSTTSSGNSVYFMDVIIDHSIINQDIYVTMFASTDEPIMNYYIELEQVKLDKNEATVATLKDMRGRE